MRIAVFALAALLLAAPAAAVELRVVDGDSVQIGQTKIRIAGIDAFELKQRCGSWACGQAAKARLVELARQGGGLDCRGSKRDKYQRLLATCHTKAGQDVAQVLVSEGLALNYDRYGAKYKADERRAREARQGAWAYSFQAPWKWRRRR